MKKPNQPTSKHEQATNSFTPDDCRLDSNNIKLIII